jgi:hypothetical protein
MGVNIIYIYRFVTARHVVGTSNNQPIQIRVSKRINYDIDTEIGQYVIFNQYKYSDAANVDNDKNRTNYQAVQKAISNRDYAFVFNLNQAILTNTCRLGLENEWKAMKHNPVELQYKGSDLLHLSSSAPFPQNQCVFKNGAKTHLTPGIVDRFLYFEDIGVRRIKITNFQDWDFASKGDSGSVVCDEFGKIIGLLVQHFSEHDFWVIIPVDEIMENLDLSFV